MSINITGNTYPVREKLKALGARWNAERKCWTVSRDKADTARAIVASAGPAKAYSGSPRRRVTQRDRYEEECELCGRNKYTCGHCIGW